jgi:hypothetical protein
VKQITLRTSIAELGAIVCEALRGEGIDAFLSGGAVVSIYTQNRYESFDLDFVSLADRTKIKRVMLALGFEVDRGRMFAHPKSQFTVEFPGSAIRVGEALITQFNELETRAGVLKLLTPTDCVKDRLAAFYHWSDRQALDQAVWVAQAQTVKIEEIKRWSKAEGKAGDFDRFKEALTALEKAKTRGQRKTYE